MRAQLSLSVTFAVLFVCFDLQKSLLCSYIYLEIKKECGEQIESLEEQLNRDGSDTKKINIEKSLDKALKYIENISKMYMRAKSTQGEV